LVIIWCMVGSPESLLTELREMWGDRDLVNKCYLVSLMLAASVESRVIRHLQRPWEKELVRKGCKVHNYSR
jgi:hypothetical protein